MGILKSPEEQGGKTRVRRSCVEKKHRVAVLRTAKAIVARRPEFAWETGDGLGRLGLASAHKGGRPQSGEPSARPDARMAWR